MPEEMRLKVTKKRYKVKRFETEKLVGLVNVLSEIRVDVSHFAFASLHSK